MRPIPNEKIEKYRCQCPGFTSPAGVDYGLFVIPVGGVKLQVISSGKDLVGAWEHVSVSLSNRCPTWTEMCHIKSKFWDDDELVMQFHPPKSEYVNTHPNCLHLWKPLNQEIKLPDVRMV